MSRVRTHEALTRHVSAAASNKSGRPQVPQGVGGVGHLGVNPMWLRKQLERKGLCKITYERSGGAERGLRRRGSGKVRMAQVRTETPETSHFTD